MTCDFFGFGAQGPEVHKGVAGYLADTVGPWAPFIRFYRLGARTLRASQVFIRVSRVSIGSHRVKGLRVYRVHKVASRALSGFRRKGVTKTDPGFDGHIPV